MHQREGIIECEGPGGKMRQRVGIIECDGPSGRESSWSNQGPQPSDLNEPAHCGPQHRGPMPCDNSRRPNYGPHPRETSHGNNRSNFHPAQYFGQTDNPSDNDNRPCCGAHKRGPAHHGHERQHCGPPPHISHFGPFDHFAPTPHIIPQPHHMGPMMSPSNHEQFLRGWPQHCRRQWDTRSCHHHHEHRCGHHHRQQSHERNNYYFIYVNNGSSH